jgi:hypothetical protein
MRSKYEIRAHKELEEDGWFVDYKSRPRRVPKGYNVDYWNCFDLAAYKPYQIRFISVKGHGGVPAEHRQALEDFKPPAGCTKEVWVYTRPTINKVKQKKEVCKKTVIQ